MPVARRVASLVFVLVALVAVAVGAGPATRPVWELLSDGKQSEAETELARRLIVDANDADAWFMLGTLTRSRFEKDEAEELFAHVRRLAPGSDHDKAAAAVVALDHAARRADDAQFDVLRGLAKAHPDEPAYVWLLAIECRTFDRNEEGVAAFAELSKHFKTGPVLLHQTYANMLDELGRYDESLVHRKLAVTLEPAPWSYHGLGSTYFSLEDYPHAAEAYKAAVRLAPRVARYRSAWCEAAFKAKDGPQTETAARELIRLDPKSLDGHKFLGGALLYENKPSEAADAFLEALRILPSDEAARTFAVIALRSSDRQAEAAEVEKSSGPPATQPKP